jgi:uncharacterized membrane protein YedE/YeeE
MLAPKRATSLTICGTIVAKAETGAGRDYGGRTGESLVNISGLSLADAGIEIWAGTALLAVLGFLLGFAINHGSICTVIATTELVSEKRPARFIALVECAVWAALVYAILEMSPTMQQGWSPLGYLVPAAMLFGIGTYVNGACVFGSVGHFGNGDIDFGFTFLGIFAVFYIALSVWPASASAADKCFPAAWAGKSRNRTVGNPGAKAPSVNQI